MLKIIMHFSLQEEDREYANVENSQFLAIPDEGL